MRASRPPAASVALARVALLAATGLATAAAAQQPAAPLSTASGGAREGVAPAPAMQPVAAGRANPTERDISLAGPLRVDGLELGEIDFVLGADDRLRVNAVGLAEALRRILSPAALEELRAGIAGLGFVPAEQLAALGYPVLYDQENIGLAIDVPAAARSTRSLRLFQQRAATEGAFDAPAGVSGYVNFRNFVSYDWQGGGRGFDGPVSYIDGAVRAGGVVLEGRAVADAAGEPAFRRDSTRLVYDDRRRLVRWTAGDLQPLSRGFAGAPSIAGIGVSRVYAQLDPLLLVQPRGNRTFALDRAANVQAVVNGQLVRQFRLQPGTYNLSDFPFAQGGNDIQLRIQDDSGAQQTVGFSIFFDRALLAPGRTEFGLYAGVLAPQTLASRDYQPDQPAASGFIRRGVTDAFTAGANFNVQRRGGVGGVEGVWANRLGTFGLDAAFSQVTGIGAGYAVNASFTTVFRRTGTTAAVAAEHRSARFADPAQFFPLNRFAWDLTATLSQRLFDSQSVSITARRALARDGFSDETSVRAQYAWRINGRLYLTGEALYQDNAFARREYGVRLRLTVRLSGRSTAYAQVDSFDERVQLGLDASRGSGVGAVSAAANTDIGVDSVGFNGSASYTANRAEIGFQHATLFDIDGTRANDQRSTLRLGTAIAFADGRFALSRPIYDSFVMAAAHRTLDGARVYLDPSRGSYEARSGILSPAVEPNFSSYIPRVATYDVPGAPSGYDLGPGAIRVLPPYRSGYLITAGSDHPVTAVGTLLDASGNPVVLLAGRATELAQPDRPALTIFTNRAGRFGLSGLKPGRWRLEMPTQPPTFADITVPAGAAGLVRLGPVTLGERP